MGKLKEEVLSYLKTQESFASGEEISKVLGVTRASVWKNIKKLQEEGYQIQASTNKGYRLVESPNIITKEELLSTLKDSTMGQSIEYYNEIESTNERAKAWAREGAVEGSLVIADSQTMGKGRLGRNWVSPSGTGIWMSLILRPDLPPTKTYQLTLLAGIAMCEAIKKHTALEAGIKWPNDIVIEGKKVCGILTEMSAEVQCIHYVVVGIGVNVNTKKLDESIPHATSLALIGNQEYSRKEIIKSFLEEFEKIYSMYHAKPSLELFLPTYKKLCITLGKQVTIIDRKEQYIALAKDINANGELVVQLEDGTLQTVLSGEVSVRGLYGYI
ncbi:MAG: biotin--[acetyl-CoA-carboxylase] ligase [Cellulosilyticaceae bacterium]